MWIQYLYKKPMKKWMFAFIISDIPMMLLLAPYFVVYWDKLWNYPFPRLVSILLAGFWTWLGPYLILRWYELFDDFLVKIDSISGSNGTAKKVYNTKLLHSKYNLIINIIWVSSVISVLLLPIGRHNLTTYYLFGFKDINYWIFILCVGYIAHFTSSFILFMLYSGMIIKAIMDNEAVVYYLIQHTGKQISMSLIGDLIARTSVYFCSGFLFFPIMTVFYLDTQNVDFNTSAAVFILMGIFIILIGLYVSIMNSIVHEKAQACKDTLIDNLEASLNQIEYYSKHCKKKKKLIYYAISKQDIRQQLSETSKICTHPLETNQYMKIVYGVLISAILPAITSFLLEMIK